VTPRQAGRKAAFVTLGVVALLSIAKSAIGGPLAALVDGLFLTALLGGPLAAAAGILTYRWRTATDSAAISSPRTEVTRHDDEWLTAARNELAAVEDPRERRRFARQALIVVVFRRAITPWVWLLAACVAVALALGLLALSRAELGFGDGVGTYTLLVPPLVLFAVGAVAAKRLGSFARGLAVAATVAVLSAIAMVPVAAAESARWYSEAGLSFLDGETATVGSTTAAVLDTLHPVFIVVHLLFWIPGPVLGARLGARAGSLGPAR
jgi:hypothetical protein